jgi:hypothetical protein
MEEVGREYAAARQRGDFDIAGVIAGESCAFIHDIPPAGEILERIGGEAERLIRAHATALSHTPRGGRLADVMAQERGDATPSNVTASARRPD